MSHRVEGATGPVTVTGPHPKTYRPSKGVIAEVEDRHLAAVLAHFPGATASPVKADPPAGSGNDDGSNSEQS